MNQSNQNTAAECSAQELSGVHNTNYSSLKSPELALITSDQKNGDTHNLTYYYEGILGVLLISQLVPNYSQEAPLVQMGLKWFFLILILMPSLYAFSKQKLQFQDVGMTKEGLGKSVAQSLWLFVAIVPLLIFSKMYVGDHTESFFSWSSLKNYSSFEFSLYCISYFFHCIVQEFIARGVGQGSLQKVYGAKNFIKPIVFASLVFSIMHIHISLSIAALIFCVSLLLGTLFYKQKNLAGVIILHFLVGITAIGLGLF